MKSEIALSADNVIFTVKDNYLQILLVKRKKEPFKSKWSLPGGLVDESELIVHAAERELEEETGLDDVKLEQFSIFDGLRRDPRGRVVSVAFFAFVNPEGLKLKAGSDADDADWFPVDDMPPLVADHEEIVDAAYNIMKESLDVYPLCWQFFKDKFTIDQLQSVYETILENELGADDFKKRMLELEVVKKLDDKYFKFEISKAL